MSIPKFHIDRTPYNEQDKHQIEFAIPLLKWFDVHGRKNLPWQLPRTPYRVWVSEIMLQQTQVQTVIEYFNRFIARFPTITDLAKASEDTVLSFWSGLGYYSRARNLHLAAKIIVEKHHSEFPEKLELLLALPGIGPSTAAAILSQAYNLPYAILDGNVKRVLARFFMLSGWPEQSQIKKMFWQHAQSCMPNIRCADYTQAIMDLGATCCTLKKPACLLCPVKTHCQAFLNNQQPLYPTKKIKKTIPIYQKQMLVLKNDDKIYLEKRPPHGIWGGLWCLPFLSESECAITFIEQNYALKGRIPEHVISFKHKLTHLHYDIKVLSITTEPLQSPIETPLIGSWFTVQQWPSVGLAKPTSNILNLINQTIN